jgi:hypothetical protein
VGRPRQTNCAARSCCSNAAGGCCNSDGVTPCGGNSCSDGVCRARLCATCKAAPPPPPTPPPPPPPPQPPPAPPCTGKSKQLRQADCAAWASFFDAAGGGQWKACAGARSDPCSCDPVVLPAPDTAAYVACNLTFDNRTRAIKEIHLRGLNLRGSAEASMGALAALEELRVLDLGLNKLSGPLPSGALLNTDVDYLDLGSNLFSGSVPASLGHLTDLQYLNLSRCGLGGALPPSLYDLNDMVTLDLSRNGFDGPVCLSSGHDCWASACTNMVHADLSYNNFSGPLPLFSKLTCLRHEMRTMNYAHNAFNGTIPAELALLGAPISSLYLQSNQLTGTVPASLKDIPLTALRLDENRLKGSVPALPFEKYWDFCDLKGNLFDCPLPAGADKCKQGPPTCTELAQALRPILAD